MYKTEAIITKVENFKENHLSISVYSSEYGQKSLVVFGGKSKKKISTYVKGSFNNIEFNNNIFGNGEMNEGTDKIELWYENNSFSMVRNKNQIFVTIN